MPIDWSQAAIALGAALGCGLLIGVERERRKGQGADRALAGVRTFTLVSVLGAATPLTGSEWLVALGGVAVVALGVAAYLRSASDDPGVTTETALFFTYIIGVLCTQHVPLAAGLAAGLTVLLAARQRMHGFVNTWLRAYEVRDGLLLAALALIALPLVPDRPLWDEVLNPRVLVQLLVLLLALQGMAHISRRLLAARHAAALSALASGFVSSTATVAAMGLAVREGRLTPAAAAGAALISCVSTLLQVPLLALAVQPAWAQWVAVPAAAGAAVAMAWGWWLLRGTHAATALPPSDADRVFSLPQAAMMAALLVAMQAVIHALGLWWGHEGARVAVLLAALFELHATVAALMTIPLPDAPSAVAVPTALLTTLSLAVAAHACSKTVNAWLSGGAGYAAHLAPGMAVHTGVFVAVLLLA